MVSPSPPSFSSEAKPRNPGVELTRGLAAFGVILIHLGLICNNRRSSAFIALQDFLTLTCVPFFLAASFYFAAVSAPRTEAFLPWLKQRSRRLLVPYILWTLIYTVLQVLQILAHPHRAEALRHLFSDPLGRVFFGASGVALYFLPLLFAGLVTQKILAPIFARRSPWILGMGVLGSLALYAGVLLTGNGTSFSVTPPFQPLLSSLFDGKLTLYWSALAPVRFCLVFIAFSINCLPYIFLGWLCARMESGPVSSHASKVFTAAFALLFVIIATVESWSLLVPLIGCGILLSALNLSWNGPHRWFFLLGRYSFAIYLMHQVPLEIIKLATYSQLRSLNLVLALSLALLVFGSCFFVAWLTDRFGGNMARTLMGLS